jgi:diguanylate cyclase (GGDEF)-like protein
MTALAATKKDGLTSLLSRKSFIEEFSRQIHYAQDHEAPLSLAFLDVDNFFQANSQFGRSGGDRILQTAAGIILEMVGKEAVVSRFGGDEFAILFPGTERERAFLILERIRAAVEAMVIPGASEQDDIQGITITGGLASFPIDGRTQTELVRKADQALYKAKGAGRNAVRLAYEERMVTKTTHFTMTQLERLAKLASERGVGEAEMLREALDDLLAKYGITDIDR